MTPRLLNELRRRFADKPNVVQIRDGSARLPARSLRSHWIVGRGLCLYRCEDFANVPKGRRPAALALQVPAWSPFENTGFHAVWSGTQAMVWFWDSDLVVVRPEELFDHPSARSAARVRIRPETVFLPAKSDGIHLQACREGFELQHWQGDVLKDAFWLRDRPDEARIDWFCRRCGQTAGLADEAQADALAAEPWGGLASPRDWVQANERALAAALLAALTLVLVWQEARIGKMNHLGGVAEAELAQREEQLGPALAARNELMSLRSRNEALADILNEPSQARIMGLADQAMPVDDASFHEWRYQQGELRLLVEDPNLDPIAYVRALEAVPLFERVQVGQTRRDNRFELTLRLRP